MSRPPASVSIRLRFILLDALLWLGFAIVTASGAIASISAHGLIRWVMVFMALVSAGCLAGLAFLLRRGSRLAYYLAVALLTCLSPIRSVFSTFSRS
jgi:hypothetical protein